MRNRRLAALVALCGILWLVPGVCADEVRLKNGDRISGRLVKETDEQVVLEHEAAGTIVIQRAYVESVQRGEPAQPVKVAQAPRRSRLRLPSRVCGRARCQPATM